VRALRTIRPVAYPGRTPHIHVKLRHASFGELTSQLFVDGDPGNERDFLWRRLRAEAQTAAAMKLQPASGRRACAGRLAMRSWCPHDVSGISVKQADRPDSVQPRPLAGAPP
jgi:protocatechuate 3,4-dioxygenase beta subunit